MKRLALVAGLVLTAAVLFVAASEQRHRRGQEVAYCGFLVGSSRLAAVAVDLAAPDNTGQRGLRAYVCDGLGPPDGIAIWFKGSVKPADITTSHPLHITSVTGHEDLLITAITEHGIYGAFTEAANKTAHYVAYPAIDGAGIYQVTLDQN